MTESSGEKRSLEDEDESPNPKRRATSSSRPLRVDAEAEIWKSITLTELDIKALYQFIRSRGDVSIANAEGYGLLYLAAQNESTEALRILLLQPDIDVNQVHGPHRELALHAAANTGQFDAVELLVEHGSSVNAADTLGHTPLSNCLFSQSLPCLEFLLKHGADATVEDEQGNTLLHLAVINNFPDAIDRLVKQNGLDINKCNQRGLSPLAVAIGLGHGESMRRLLTHGADVDSKTRFGTVLHHAVTWNRMDAVQNLIQRGCQVNALNAMEETPLLVAVQQRKIDMVAYLVQHGADPCQSTGQANVPLLYAANHGYTEMCRLLLTPPTPSFFIQSAAEMSMRSGFPETAKFLLSKLEPADPSTNDDERTEQAAASEEPLLAENDFDALINTFSDDEELLPSTERHDQ